MTFSLVPDCGGPIDEIAISIPSSMFDADGGRYMAALNSACRALAGRARMTVLTEADGAPAATAWLDGLRLSTSPTIAPFAPAGELNNGGYWIQDPFLCAMQGGQKKYLLISGFSNGGHGEWLRQSDHTPAQTIDVSLEGGNCLVGNGFWLVGTDSIQRTAERITHDADAAWRLISGIDSRQLYEVGYDLADIPRKLDWFVAEVRHRARVKHNRTTENASSAIVKSRSHAAIAHAGRLLIAAVDILREWGKLRQPWYHVDLFISVTGKVKDGKPLIFVARPLASADLDGPPDRPFGGRVAATIKRLESHFTILRNPVPVLPLVQGSSESWPRCYNNVLVQNDPDIVWLPQFAIEEPALAEIDRENRRLWAKEGFEVMTVTGWTAFTRSLGALRCAVKVLRRRQHERGSRMESSREFRQK